MKAVGVFWPHECDSWSGKLLAYVYIYYHLELESLACCSKSLLVFSEMSIFYLLQDDDVYIYIYLNRYLFIFLSHVFFNTIYICMHMVYILILPYSHDLHANTRTVAHMRTCLLFIFVFASNCEYILLSGCWSSLRRCFCQADKEFPKEL